MNFVLLIALGVSIVGLHSASGAPGVVSDTETGDKSKGRYNVGISIVGGAGPHPGNGIGGERYPPGNVEKYPVRDPERYPVRPGGGNRDRYPEGHPDRDRYPGGRPGGDRDRYPGGHPGGDRDRYPGGRPGGDRDRYPDVEGGHSHYPDHQGPGHGGGHLEAYPEHDYVTFFERPYFKGWSFNAKLSRQCRNLENDYGSYNNGISSIKTHGNCLIVFTRFDCRGREYIIRPNYGHGPHRRQVQGQNRYRPAVGHSELAEDLNNSISSYRRC